MKIYTSIFKGNYVAIAGIISIAILMILLPKALLILLIFNFVIICLHGFSQLWWAIQNRKSSNSIPGEEKSLGSTPKISIHIPAHNEPAEVLISTIKSCLNIDYPNFEIIVLDNNTPNEETWKPVAHFCEDKEAVSFYHINNLKGYKAGALNICMDLTAADAKYIFIVDADYSVTPNCLKTAVEIAESQNAGLVQFPQDYFSNGSNEALIEEYAHYFKVFAKGGNYNNSVLATGTLSFYRKDALEKVNGWKCNTITEDAEMGLKFQEHNFKAVFSGKTVGKGLLPFSVKDIKIQRERWVYGNMQCIEKLFKSPKINIWRKFSLMVQLTSWVNFLNLSLLASLVSILLFPVLSFALIFQVLLLTVINIWVFMAFKFILFGISTRFRMKLHLQTWLINLVFTGLNTFCWFGVLQGREKPFRRTSKFSAKASGGVQSSFLGVLFLAFSFILVLKAHFFLAGLFFLPSVFIFTGLAILKKQLEHQDTPIKKLKEIRL